MIPVVLSGGSGTRLWPVSREKFPKQFCDLFDESLQTMTLRRLAPWGDPWIVTGRQLQDFTEKKAAEAGVKPEVIAFEPEAKNTAAAVALACRIAQLRKREQEVMGVFPADHLIEKAEVFASSIELASAVAAKGKVVTIGLKPSSPETGYGYIQTRTTPAEVGKTLSAFEVVRFHEKPSRETAMQFMREGSYYWNAGVFVFSVQKMIELFRQFQPQIWSKFADLREDLANLPEIYGQLANISIDYAIMERLGGEDLVCIPCQPGWSDVGSWDAVAQVYEKSGKAKVKTYSLDSKNNFILPAKGKTYAVVGVDDVMVVDTADALLLVKRGHSQDVKTVVDQIKKMSPNLAKNHVFEERPWGKFEILREEDHFKSKVIVVNPHSQISYQSHDKREEHWLVVLGAGEVILDEKTHAVWAGSYIKIPQGSKHRVRNSSDKPLQFIEVQLGTYFGEDDIKRYSDDYGRSVMS